MNWASTKNRTSWRFSHFSVSTADSVTGGCIFTVVLSGITGIPFMGLFTRKPQPVPVPDTDELPSHLPRHVAIIMDGNGRWAKQRGLPRSAGHHQGTENLRRILKAAVEFGVEILTIYAFSTENWNRPRHEVFLLMRILEMVID